MKREVSKSCAEKKLQQIEENWLAAPEEAELVEVYTCGLCGNPIWEGEEYLAVADCGEVCCECLESLSAKDFALAALDLRTGAAGSEGSTF